MTDRVEGQSVRQRMEAASDDRAREFAHGCWCSHKPHEGWCDGKHHERMRQCPHESILTAEDGSRRCEGCGWCFSTWGKVNGVPTLLEHRAP